MSTLSSNTRGAVSDRRGSETLQVVSPRNQEVHTGSNNTLSLANSM